MSKAWAVVDGRNRIKTWSGYIGCEQLEVFRYKREAELASEEWEENASDSGPHKVIRVNVEIIKP